MEGLTKQCKRCGRMMKRLSEGFFHCKCGTSWTADSGFIQVANIQKEKEWKSQANNTPAQQRSKDTSRTFHIAKEDSVAQPLLSRRKLIRGGIYYIFPHPTYGHETYSGRPAVVLSEVTASKNKHVVTVAYLTSKQKKPSKTHTEINSSDRKATVLVEQLDTVDTELVGSYMGICSPQEMIQIKRCLANHFGFVGIDNYDDRDTAAYIAQLEHQVVALTEKLQEQTTQLRELSNK